MRDAATVQLLTRVCEGDRDAARDLMPIVYDRLRALAASYFQRERSDHTLQPTALVNEAFVQLVDRKDPRWNGRTHFFAIAASEMRRILVDHARARHALKRGGGRRRVTLSGLASELPSQLDAMALDDALRSLSEVDERAARIVELRYFGGLAVEEIASVLGVTSRTIRNDWRTARAWLLAELGKPDAN